MTMNTPSDMNTNLEQDSSNLGNSIPTTDSQISHAQQISYWGEQTADVDGMLGGYPQVSRIDLQSSKNFVAKIRRLDRGNQVAHEPAKPNPSSGKAAADGSTKSSTPKVARALETGAGIGRITTGLLLTVANTVDIVEPIKKFTDVLAQYQPTADQGLIGEIYNSGLETWKPPSGIKYDIVWNQWCLGHLTDQQLVDYLQRLARCLAGYDDQGQEEATYSGTPGWIMVKENLSTDVYDEDIFDDADSSVTRSDKKWKALFDEAGLKIVKMELQTGFPKSLYPVKMYALRPK